MHKPIASWPSCCIKLTILLAGHQTRWRGEKTAAIATSHAQITVGGHNTLAGVT